MLCARIQEILKTDYLDGELNPQEERRILEHLKQCPGCQALEKELRTQSSLFKEAKQQQVPERLWQNIRDSIYSQGLTQEQGMIRGIAERLKGLIFMPRPAFALAGALSVVILVVFLAGSIIQKERYTHQEEEAAFALYSQNGENGDQALGLGTSIEEYFL